MLINYFNTEGQKKKIYEKAFNEKDIGQIDDIIIDENDPRYKLKKLQEEEEWNRFKNKHKPPVAVYSQAERQQKMLEEKKSLPYNPDVIVIPKDPKPKAVRKRERIPEILNDVPREGKVVLRTERDKDYQASLATQAGNEDDFNNLMLIDEINKRHPRKSDDNGAPKRFSICDGLGFFGCKDDWNFSIFSKYGVGFGDYFRVLKMNVIFFLVLFIISLSFLLSTKNKEKDKMFGYSSLRDAFFRVTMGHHMKSFYLCKNLELKVDGKNYFTHQFTCDKEGYSVDKYSISYFGLSDRDVEIYNCHDYSRNEMIKTECDISRHIHKNTTCEDNICSLTLNMTFVETNITKGTCQQEFATMQYLCYYKPSKNYRTTFIIITWFVVILYLAYCVTLHFFIKNSQRVHTENKYEISQYSIIVKNLSLSTKPPMLYIELNELLQALLKASMFQPLPKDDGTEDFFNFTPIIEPTLSIYQFAYPSFDNLILGSVKDKYNLLFKYEIPSYSNKKANAFTSSIANNKYDLNLAGESKSSVMKKITRYDNVLKFYEDNPDKIEYPITEVYVTFKTKMHAEKCYKCYRSKNCLTRFFIWFICKKKYIKDFYFRNKWLDVEYMPNSPECINWENLRMGPEKRIVPFFLSVITIALFCILSLSIYYSGIIKIRDFDESFSNYSSCEFVELSQTLIDSENDNLNFKRNRMSTFCQCKKTYLEKGHKEAMEIKYKGISICSEWLDTMSKANKAFAVVCVLQSILNIIAYYVIPLTSCLEKHRNTNNERCSTLIKTFVYSLFVNGILVVVSHGHVSEKYNDNVPTSIFFTGNALPFSTIWHYYCGSTILMNIILSSITPYFVEYSKWFILYFIRRFGCKDILKKKNKHHFLFWFIGPECHIEANLGNLLGLITICIFFGLSVTEPLSMLLIALLSFTSFYLDKILFIHYQKKPKKYNQQIIKTFLTSLYTIVIIGLFFNCYVITLSLGEIPDASTIFSQLYTIVRDLKFMVFAILAACLIFITYFIYRWVPCIFFCCFKKTDIAAGFGEDEDFEKKALNDYTIYEALPLGVLYKNYVIRKLEYSNFCKYELDCDLTEALKFYRQRLDTDRNAIQMKLKALTGKECPTSSGFDEKIKNIMDRYEELEDSKIKDNFSYNLCYNDLYQTVYLNKMLEK